MASEPARHSPALTATVGELDAASAPRAASIERPAGLTLRQVDEGSTAAAVTQAALPSADTVMAARQSVAQNFMRDMGWSDSRIEGHLKGIDFNQPVDLVELQAGQKLQQWQLPDRPTGHYFTDLGIPAEALGINPAGRVANVHVAPHDVVLRSTAAPIVDTWTVPGQPFAAKGGGVQYFTARPGDYGRVGGATVREVRSESAGGTNQYVNDLSPYTGSRVRNGNRAISEIINEDFQKLKFSYRPQFSPYAETGITGYAPYYDRPGVQIGYKSLASRAALRDTIVHEELHNRWRYRSGITENHHFPGGELDYPVELKHRDMKFYATVERYKSMRGWDYSPAVLAEWNAYVKAEATDRIDILKNHF